MEDTGIKIKVKIEGYEELVKLENKLEAMSLLIEGLEKASEKLMENCEVLKNASDDEAQW